MEENRVVDEYRPREEVVNWICDVRFKGYKGDFNNGNERIGSVEELRNAMISGTLEGRKYYELFGGSNGEYYDQRDNPRTVSMTEVEAMLVLQENQRRLRARRRGRN